MVSVLKRSTAWQPVVWMCIVGTLALLAWPATADAQRRRAVRRAGPVLQTRAWYGPGYGYFNPYFYRPYAFRPYGYGPYGYGPYLYGGWGQYPYYGAHGSLRIQVKPEATEVYVDGYYAGVADSYDGIFQRLHLEPGAHDIELRLDGFRSIQEQVYLTVGTTWRIRHEMEPLGPGETTPPPPAPATAPAGAPALPGTRAGPALPGTRGGPGLPPSAAAASFGRLAIRVQPQNAVIVVDGEEWRTPDAARLELDVGAGRHRIEVRADGYEGYLTDVQVRPGETTAVNVSLPRDEGSPPPDR